MRVAPGGLPDEEAGDVTPLLQTSDETCGWNQMSRQPRGDDDRTRLQGNWLEFEVRMNSLYFFTTLSCTSSGLPSGHVFILSTSTLPDGVFVKAGASRRQRQKSFE